VTWVSECQGHTPRVPEQRHAELAAAAARVPPGWELAALALVAVPFAFTDITARRLPDRMTCQRLHRRLTPLAVAAITEHEPGRHARARSAQQPTPALPGPVLHPPG
jgi:hypothetical protein